MEWRVRERIADKLAGLECAAEVELAIVAAMQPYVDRFHADDKTAEVTRRVRVFTEARSNARRFEEEAQDLRAILAELPAPPAA